MGIQEVLGRVWLIQVLSTLSIPVDFTILCCEVVHHTYKGSFIVVQLQISIVGVSNIIGAYLEERIPTPLSIVGFKT